MVANQKLMPRMRMAEIKLSVQGMNSNSCIGMVTQALSSIEGVKSIRADIQSGRVEITRTIDKSDDLIHALDTLGYPSSLDLDEQ